MNTQNKLPMKEIVIASWSLIKIIM